MNNFQKTNFTISSLHKRFQNGELSPTDIIELHLERAEQGPEDAWITRINPDRLYARAENLESETDPTNLKTTEQPLYGIPFAIKDNIDYKGVPTTAACPDYEYTPTDHASVINKLINAGGIMVGKTNLDQFATGLVGTRSPYGETPNAIDPAYISGGSSAGSGVAVSLDQVSFALGTDTAGSGRVPAALNGVVGLKPTRGVISNSGVVPACKSLDCVSIFASTVNDALAVEEVAAGFDPTDEYSRPTADELDLTFESEPTTLKVGIPQQDQLTFFGDDAAADCFGSTVEWFDVHYEIERLDIEPLIDAGRLLYQGPWVAERLAAIRDLLTEHPDALLPITRGIITRGREFDAVDTYNAQYKLRRLSRRSQELLSTVDVLVTPTTGTIYTREAVNNNPIETNSNLGHYTNFVNLLDLAAIAVPGGRRSNGIPFGITMFSEKFSDATLATIANMYCQKRNVRIGSHDTSYSALSSN